MMMRVAVPRPAFGLSGLMLIMILLFVPVPTYISNAVEPIDESRERDSLKVVHVYVALCDNEHQGIVPVAADLGNGQNPRTNLYWGALYGVRTFISNSDRWQSVSRAELSADTILERCVFLSSESTTVIVADAYDGRRIRVAIEHFLEAAAGHREDSTRIGDSMIRVAGRADLLAYVGHNGLMDFTLGLTPSAKDSLTRRAIVLACA
ncbi:hypothetical protein GF356_13590, partial [candidate division GN15 bacterium]|nr:hypothetical protein [candidate division GN15 bacterium]